MTLFFTALNHLAVLSVTGEKAQSFLQGQLTCDINEVSEQRSLTGAHCNPKGRVLISLRVVYFQQQYYLIVPKDNAEFAQQQLQKYANLSRVQLAPAQDITLLGCWGESPSISVPTEADQTFSLDSGLIIRERGPMPRFMLFSSQGQLPDLQLTPASAQDWQLLAIQHDPAHIYPASRDLFTPQMIDYPKFNAVSFKKGCYIGQEIIARTHYLGKAKRHIHLFNLSQQNPVHPGDKILTMAQEEAGIVVDSVFEHQAQKVRAVIRDEVLDKELFLDTCQLNLLQS